MNTAAFKLEKYLFDKVSMDLSKLKAETTFNIDFDPSGEFYPDKDKYILTFVFSAKDDESDNEIINIRCRATYLFRGLNESKDIPDYFFNNAIAILFPYVRAFVSTITLQANVAPMVLPTLNLSELKDTLASHTTRM
jgi:preprotein translocase subunit SecB